MKFTSLTAFQTHLKKSAPDHFSRIYAIFLEDEFERGYHSKKIFHFMQHYLPELKWESNLDALDQMSLFAESRLIGIELSEEMDEEDLAKKLMHLEPKTRILLSGDKLRANLYEALKGEIVCLDLSAEKPWEKKKRILEELIKMAKGLQKNLNVDGANALIEQCGLDFAALKNELEKIASFVGKAGEISLSDIHKLCAFQKEQNFWTIAEDTVWKGDAEVPIFKDLSAWLGLVGQIRYQLYIGIEICDQMAKGEAIHIKNVRPNQIEWMAPKARALGVGYFIDRLKALFELELLAKSHTVNPSVLWDLLVVKFTHGAAFVTESPRR